MSTTALSSKDNDYLPRKNSFLKLVITFIRDTMKNGGLWLSRKCEAQAEKEAMCTDHYKHLSWNPALEEIAVEEILQIGFIL